MATEGPMHPDSVPVLVVAPRLDVGGTERHLLRVLPRLRQSGIDAQIFVIHPGGHLEDDMRAAGVPVLSPPAMSKAWLRLALAGLMLMWIMLTQRKRLVHFFLPEAYLAGGLAGFMAGCRRMIMSRRSLNRYQRAHPIATRIEYFLHRRMALLVANSQAVATDLRQENAPTERIRLIYNGIDSEPFTRPLDRTALRAELGIGPNTLVFCIVANLLPYKGHSDLLDALANWSGRDGDWALLCVGRDDGAKADLARRCKAAQMDGKVHFLGQRSDVPALMGISDMGLLCSREEGFSNSILEGMAAGLPMIVSDAGGNGEAIAHGRTGLIYPAGDVAALGAALDYLAGQPDLRRSLGAAARQWVQTNLSIEACVQRYTELYHSLRVPA
ncbi:MAG: glycosyltransferase [Rhodospirillaceae bacterium]|nr:glycosyltransferase [Rhodospirillales bacterium]